MRISQYLLRLTSITYASSDADHIAIFDQASIQVVCSLAVFNREADDKSLGSALDITPESDLLIHVDVPERLLQERLNDRLQRQSYMERLFEAGPKTDLQMKPIANHVNSLLRSRGRSVISIYSCDEHIFEEIIDHNRSGDSGHALCQTRRDRQRTLHHHSRGPLPGCGVRSAGGGATGQTGRGWTYFHV
jgi:hypothetical protein